MNNKAMDFGKVKKRPWIVDLPLFFIQRKLLGKPIPLFASFKVTYRCNLACGPCPFHQRAGEPGAHISWEKAVACMHELKARGCRIVMFEGGEPLIWKDGSHTFSELVRYAKNLFLRVGFTTNGTRPLDVPADVLWVSLDGLKETHDRLRSNSFDQVWENLSKAQHPKVLIHFTMNRENWRDVETLLRQLQPVQAVKGVTVQLFYPYGQGEEPLALIGNERREAIENVLRLKGRGYPIINSRAILKSMIENTWHCRDDILVNVDPDGTITTGCYVKSRGEVCCVDCGFTPVAEAVGALNLKPGSIIAGWRSFIQ